MLFNVFATQYAEIVVCALEPVILDAAYVPEHFHLYGLP